MFVLSVYILAATLLLSVKQKKERNIKTSVTVMQMAVVRGCAKAHKPDTRRYSANNVQRVSTFGSIFVRICVIVVRKLVSRVMHLIGLTETECNLIWKKVTTYVQKLGSTEQDFCSCRPLRDAVTAQHLVEYFKGNIRMRKTHFGCLKYSCVCPLMWQQPVRRSNRYRD